MNKLVGDASGCYASRCLAFLCEGQGFTFKSKGSVLFTCILQHIGIIKLSCQF